MYEAVNTNRLMCTEEDVLQLWQSTLLANPSIESKMTVEDLRPWYGGYYALDGTPVYRHSSVWQALASGQLVSYWKDKGVLDRGYQIISLASKDAKAELLVLASGGSTRISLSPIAIQKIQDPGPSADDDDDDDGRFALLVAMGLLSVKTISEILHDPDFGRVQIPNKEVHLGFWADWVEAIAQDYWCEHESDSSVLADKLHESILSGDVHRVRSSLNQTLESMTFSCSDRLGDMGYAFFILSLLHFRTVSQADGWEYLCELEPRSGRIYIRAVILTGNEEILLCVRAARSSLEEASVEGLRLLEQKVDRFKPHSIVGAYQVLGYSLDILGNESYVQCRSMSGWHRRQDASPGAGEVDSMSNLFNTMTV